MKEGFGMNSAQGFYGQFEMINSKRRWQLTRNKTNSENLYDVLNGEYMQKTVIRPLLDLLKSRGERLKIQMNIKVVSNSLTKLLQNTKVKIENENEQISLPALNGSSMAAKYPDGNRGNLKPGDNSRTKVPSEDTIRRKRRYDPLSQVKDKIRQIQEVAVWPHGELKGRGLFFITMAERGTIMKIFIDKSSKFGKCLWDNREIYRTMQ
jgi:hypothetical protein